MAQLQLELNRILTADHPYPDDVAALSTWLYDHCYAKSILAAQDAAVIAGDRDQLVPLLSAANQSRSSWDEGWVVDHFLSNGRVLARKNGALRVFLAGEYISSDGPGCGARSHGPLMVFVTAESKSLQQGYYYAFGETIGRFEDAAGILRFYWNISADGAPHLIEHATRGLNRFQAAFRIKCLSTRSSYPRRDAAVLYVNSHYYPIVALVLESLHDRLRPWLSSDTPLFTRELAPGLGFAEDPGLSFGQHRCRLLAGAMVRSRGMSLPDRLQVLKDDFKHRGLAFERPWLNNAAPDCYPFPFQS